MGRLHRHLDLDQVVGVTGADQIELHQGPEVHRGAGPLVTGVSYPRQPHHNQCTERLERHSLPVHSMHECQN